MALEPEDLLALPTEVKAASRRASLIGIGQICCAVLFFSCLDSTSKLLNPRIGAIEVAWARYVSGLVLTLLVLNPWTHPALLRSGVLALQLTRSVLLCGSTVCAMTALGYLRLDQVVTFAFSVPLLVTALSGPLLDEWAGPRRWVAIVIGFCGVLIAVRPGLGVFPPQGLIMTGAVLCYVFYLIITRIVARTDSSETSLLYTNLVGAVVLTPVVPLFWKTPQTPGTVAMMVMMGALGSFGHYLLIRAHKHTPANVLAPFVYIQIVWSILLGYLIFADVPDALTLVGATIVIGSGLYLLHREHVRGLR